MRRFASFLCRSGSEVLFLPPNRWGILVVLVTLARPTAALTGLVAVAASRGLAALIGLDSKAADRGFYWYNPFLVGLSIGYHFQLSAHLAAFAAVAGGLTLLVCIATSHSLKEFFALPVLSVPFVVVSTVVYLVCTQHPGLEPQLSCLSLLPHDGPPLPQPVSGFFTAFGTVFFVSNVWAGMILAGIVLYHSRVLFFLSILGYGVGATAGLFLADSGQAVFVDPNSFNFILVAMALGGGFLVPSVRSYLIAAIGVASAALILAAWPAISNDGSVPPFAFPFNIAVLGILYSLRLADFQGLVATPGRTPEETLELDIVNRSRFPGSVRTIELPFSGAWTVWQGFDGRWTHQGPWRFAYDFVITDESGKSHQGTGRELEDYYCFRKPVLSPIAGRVVRVVSRLPDRPIGQADGAQNWGNAVVLQDHRGFFVEISHFATESIRVVIGQEVARGEILGLCGNSGYSPQPHIHIQVQATDQIGAGTLPFSFTSCVVGRQYFANDLPDEFTIIEAVWPNQAIDAATSCYLDQRIDYEAMQCAAVVGHLSLSVQMAIDGTFYFESDDGGRLYFGKHTGTYFAYRMEGDNPWLRLLFAALPKLPLGHMQGLTWNDCVPVGVIHSGWRRTLLRLACVFVPSLAGVRTAHCFLRRDTVETRIDDPLGGYTDPITVVLGADSPIASVSMGDLALRRVAAPDEKVTALETPVNQELQPIFHLDHR